MYRFAALAAVALIYAGPVSAATADDMKSCFSDKSDPRAAVAACGRLLSSRKFKGSNLANLYDWRSHAAAKIFDWRRVIADTSRALDLGSSNKATLFTRRAHAFTLTQEYVRAISDLDQAIRLDPKRAAQYNDRGFSHHMLKDYDRAIADYDGAIRIDPTFAESWSNRGNTWQEKGDFDRAIADHDRAIDLKPKVAALYCNRGGAFREKGDFDRALADLDECARLDPTLPNPYVGRGLILRARNEFDRAIAEYDRSVALNPRLPSAYTGRGLAHEGRRDIDSAKRDFQKALSLPSGTVIALSPAVANVDIHADRYKDIAKARLAVLADADRSEPPAAVPPSRPIRTAADARDDRNAGRRTALVIGNGGYASAAALSNPPNDARAIAAQLRAIGFDVSEGIDLDRTALQRLTNDFLRSATTSRVAIVFYAGHGIQIDGKNYLVPVDAKFETAGSIEAEMVDVERILAGLDDQIRTNIVILDACRDNPMAQKVAQVEASRSLIVRSGLAAPSEIGRGGMLGAGTLIAFATAPGQVALDGEGANSPFTAALSRHISTPGLEVQQMLTRVRAEVVASTKGKQVPWSNSSLLGEVFLVGSKL